MICEKCGHDNKPKCLVCGNEIERGRFCSGACKKRHQRSNGEIKPAKLEGTNIVPKAGQKPNVPKKGQAKVSPKSDAIKAAPASAQPVRVITEGLPSKKPFWCGLKGMETKK